MAAYSRAEECLDYRLPGESPSLAAYTTTEEVRLLAADGDFLCWAGIDNGNHYTILNWCMEGPSGALLPLGSHRAQRNGADYAGNHLQVNGERVVLGDWSGGWQVVDFSIPSSPTVPWEAPTGTTIGGPVLSGDHLLVPTSAGLAVLELVPGGPPVLRSLVDLVPSDSGESPWAMRLATDGTRCWAIVGYPTGGSLAQFLVVVDITDPDAPSVSAPLSLGYSSDGVDTTYRSLAVDGGTAIATRKIRYSSGRPLEFSDTFETLFFTLAESGAPALAQCESSSLCGDSELSGDHAWVAESNTIRYFERRGGAWYMRQSVATSADGTPHLAASAHAVWTGYGRDLRAWADRIPASSPNLGVAYRPLTGHCIGLDAVGNRLVTLVYGQGYGFSEIEPWGFVELDATDPLRLVPSVASATASVWFVYSHIVGDHAYTNRGIYDLTTHAWLGGTSPPVFGGTGIALWAWESPGHLVTYDATDPAAPARRTECFAIDGDWWELPAVASVGAIAIFAHGDTLIAADVTAPLDPVVVDRLAVPFSGVRAMVMGNDLLYVAHAGGLSVVAVGSDGSLALRGQASGSVSGLSALALDDRLLYAVTSSGSQLQIFDVGDPALPLLIAEPGAFGYNLLLRGDMLYGAGYSITALRRQCSLSVPVSLRYLDLVWLADAARLSWRLDETLAAVRVLARSGNREWVVPWQTEGEFSVAIDERAPAGLTVDYAVQFLADDQWLTIAEASLVIPEATLALAAPMPNPFNAATACEFTLDAAGFVELTVLDVAGRVVRTLLAEPRTEGHHRVVWRGDDANGRPVAAGAYLVRLTAAKGVRTVKAVLLK